MDDLFIDGGAEFSECRRYRYIMWRKWGPEPWLACVMLNPPTDAERHNDASNERVERRARRMGFGGVSFTNLFPWMAATPKEMRAAEDPIGPWDRARDAVLDAAAESGMVLCGWGNHGLYKQRGLFIREMLHAHGIEPHILRLTGQDQPAHPLYIPYTVKPVLWPYEPPKANIDAMETEAAGG